MDCTWMSNFECRFMNTWFAQTMMDFRDWFYGTSFAKWMQGVVSSFVQVWWKLVDIFMQTPLWKICWFIWDLISFLLYWVRSIILLVRNLIYTILNGFVQMFTQLMSTFTDLSVFMWSSTSMLVSMFTLVLMIIWFWFLLRFFTWKYHYNRVKK